MKKLQVPVTDELMNRAKLYAFQHGITLKEVVTLALTVYTSNTATTPSTSTTTTIPTKTSTSNTSNTKSKTTKSSKANTTTTTTTSNTEDDFVPSPELLAIWNEESDKMDERYFYVVRKPEYEGAPETQDHVLKTNGMVEWYLDEGDTQYFDKDRYLIPFRYKKANGKDHFPTNAEIAQLKEAYEKPITVEK